MSYPQKSRSNVWYLLPILVGMIGGIIAYLVIRKDDPHKAKNCIYIGIVMMVIGIIFNILVLGYPEFFENPNAEIIYR